MDATTSPTVGELADDETPDPDIQQVPPERVSQVGEKDAEESSADSLFDSTAAARIVALWVITPSVSVLGAYLLFSFIA